MVGRRALAVNRVQQLVAVDRAESVEHEVGETAAPPWRRGLRARLGGLLGASSDAGRDLDGGPQMLQLSLDGRRLYVTNSLYSTWDNQFYPELRSWLLRVNCDPNGGMEVDRDFFVDFHAASPPEIANGLAGVTTTW